jgi:cysteine desulfurase
MRPRIYADHAATTPTRPEVVEAMHAYLRDGAYNPSSLHAEGRRAKASLDDARERVAHVLGAKPREIVFTGSGSEADNLALRGAARALRGRGRRIVSSAGEHHAVLHALDALADEGYAITLLPVDRDGLVDLAAFAAALEPGTVLASIMLANNELGSVAPVRELAAAARARGVVFHTDAIQAAGRLPLDVAALGVDLLSLSAHKCYGPHGVGALYVREGTPLSGLIAGGSQESGLRAGTENVAGIVGFAAALELAAVELALESARLTALRDRFEETLAKRIPGLRVNAAGAPRLPNLSSITVPGLDATALAIRLDLEGVAVSTGSACASGAAEPSHVLRAAGIAQAASTLRFSFGRATGRQEVDALLEMLPEVVSAIRVDTHSLGTNQLGSVTSRSEEHFDS